MCECALSTANKCTKHAKLMRAYCPNLFPINCINKTQKKAEVKKRERNAKRNLRHLFTGERRTSPDLHGLASGSAFDGSCRGGRCWVLAGFVAGSQGSPGHCWMDVGCCRKAKELCLARDKAINSVRNLI